MSMMVGRRKYSVVKRKFNCNYCGHSLIIEVEEHDYMDRMCMKCNRALKTSRDIDINENK
jgi:transcription elongation factor Elf1